MANRLAGATSPYLLQHADNPVEWWPWGSEAFAEARRRDVPVLLSVGYAACHWCHVMAHESFEDPAIAAVLNEHFVNVKVDREERPDVDAVYMEATQAMTGQGGWPMTVFLTPDAEPFHCGTYYPPRPVRGMPSFTQLLEAVVRAWTERGDEVRRTASSIVEKLSEDRVLPESTVDESVLAAAVRSLHESFDAERGGFGQAPKFPPSMVLEFLLRHVERVGDSETGALAEDMVLAGAGAMAGGGLYDQLAGGFARYSVDADWVVPHFEKMLYDNALLLRLYAHLARRGSALAERITRDTTRFVLDELRTPEGGFAASLDADTDGVEGLTYVWTPAQLRATLGDEDGTWAAELLDVTEPGTFEHGASTLQLRRAPDDAARWQRVRAALLAAREQRPQPARDDKVVTAWNGMLITALAEAGAALGEPDWVDAAERAAALLTERHLVSDRLARSSRDGVVGTAPGVLEDYGCLAEGLLALHQVTGLRSHLDRACALLDVALEQFADSEHPGLFHDTAADAEKLVRRPSEPADNASPSGASATAAALLTASLLTDPPRATRYREAAEAALRRASLLLSRAPRFAGHWLAVAESLVTGPLQVAIVGRDADERAALLAAARRSVPGGAVVVAGAPEADVALLRDRPLSAGRPAAYVCRGFVCDRPVTEPDELDRALRAR